ncbi:hypothetical protein QYE76_013062 [Lolium multiflorum]|uniref:Uncharacterized protein n=1 Tax=Lolium multiflorum TaxID=4521 RepID=A0AAD8X5J2_LOLMU|nr:hypothetical protein QYE76_013062 [Lolium multiflorum]
MLPASPPLQGKNKAQRQNYKTMDIVTYAAIRMKNCPELVKQFFATLAIKKDEERTMEWMSGSTHCEATLRRFALFLDFLQGGRRLHGPQKTDKNVLLISITLLERWYYQGAASHLRLRCARDSNEEHDFSLDVMDFIFNEIHDAMVSRTTMPYAPYIQLLINNSVAMDLRRFPLEHSVKKAYKKKPSPWYPCS